jgi:hypothetical protein
MCLAALGSCYAVLDPVTRTMADLRHDFAFDPSYGYDLEDLLAGALLPRSVPQHTTADLDRSLLDRSLLARAPRHPPARPLHRGRVRRGPLDGRQRPAAAPRRAPRTDRLHGRQFWRRDRGTGPALGAAHCPRPSQRADLRPPGSADLRPRCSRITAWSRAPLLLTRSSVPRVDQLGAGPKGLHSCSSWRKHQRPARTA